MKNDVKKEIVKKRPTRQKLVVSQGRALIGDPIEYKVLYTEVVSDRETAKIREKPIAKPTNIMIEEMAAFVVLTPYLCSINGTTHSSANALNGKYVIAP